LSNNKTASISTNTSPRYHNHHNLHSLQSQALAMP
jgi:hypothetical protein